MELITSSVKVIPFQTTSTVLPSSSITLLSQSAMIWNWGVTPKLSAKARAMSASKPTHWPLAS